MVALAVFAGFTDAIVGGGGLILVPGMLTLLPQVPIPVLFGTNKLASVAGTCVASVRYARSVPLQWRWLSLAFITAVVFSIGGSKLATVVSPQIFRPILLIFFVLVAYLNFRPPSIPSNATPLPINVGKIVLMCAVIAFYDGFIGPGTGVFLIFGFVRYFRLSFLQASAHAKMINMASNIGALMFFLTHGYVLWILGLILALANMSGSYWGSHLAIKKGSPFIQWMFRLVVVALIVKLAWDSARLIFDHR